MKNYQKRSTLYVEEIRNLGVENLDQMFMEIYMEQADRLTDSRRRKKVKHLLKDIVEIVFFAVFAENDEWTEIGDFSADEKETMKKYLELPNGIPSYNTIQKIFLSCARKNWRNASGGRNLNEFNVMSTE